MIYNLILLAVLVRLLLAVEKPLLCASLYTVLPLVFGLAYGGPSLRLLISVSLSFVLAWAYFWLLNTVETGTALWWLVAVLGIAIGLV